MNLKTTWSKGVFSVNLVKSRPHDAPHALSRSGAKGGLANFKYISIK